MFKNISKMIFILALVPFILYCAFIIFTQATVNYITILVGSAIIIVSYGISSYNKRLIKLAILLLTILCISLSIAAFYNQETPSVKIYISITVFIYYMALYYLKNWTLKDQKYLKNIFRNFK